MTTQETLPGVEPAITDQAMWRVNYQFQGPNYALRAGVLILPARTITEAKALAKETITAQHGARWTNITKVSNITEVPF